MSKIELDNIASGYNLGKINANFVKLQEALDNRVLFRDNTTTPNEPNQMEQGIDMNGESILNLPTPTAPTNPVRLQDLADYALATELTEVDNRLTAADVTLQNNIDTANSLRISGDAILAGDINALDGRVTTLETGTAGDTRYIHWLYNNGSALGGEVQLNIPYEFTSIATVHVNGVRMSYGLAFSYDVVTETVQLAEALEEGDEVVVSIGTEPVDIPTAPQIYVQYLYNNGSAVGGELLIDIPYAFTSISGVHINGISMTYGLAFDYDVSTKVVQLADALKAGDELVVSVGTEPLEATALIQSATEEVVLVDGQTVVDFIVQDTNAAEFYVNGPSVDSRLLSSEDFTKSSTTSTSITLTESYPAGSIITLAKNIAKSFDGNIRRELVHNIASLAVATASTNIAVGDAINLAERTTGNSGGATWDVVLSSSVTEDGFGIVQCTGIPTLSLVLRINKGSVEASALGSLSDAVAYMRTASFNTLVGGSNTYTIDSKIIIDCVGMNDDKVIDLTGTMLVHSASDNCIEIISSTKESQLPTLTIISGESALFDDSDVGIRIKDTRNTRVYSHKVWGDVAKTAIRGTGFEIVNQDAYTERTMLIDCSAPYTKHHVHFILKGGEDGGLSFARTLIKDFFVSGGVSGEAFFKISSEVGSLGIGSLANQYQIGETVIQTNSGATAVVVGYPEARDLIFINTVTGVFNNTDNVVGQISGTSKPNSNYIVNRLPNVYDSIFDGLRGNMNADTILMSIGGGMVGTNIKNLGTEASTGGVAYYFEDSDNWTYERPTIELPDPTAQMQLFSNTRTNKTSRAKLFIDGITLTPNDVQPDIAEGVIAVSDGVGWNPQSIGTGNGGKGVFARLNSSWVRLVDFLTSNEADFNNAASNVNVNNKYQGKVAYDTDRKTLRAAEFAGASTAWFTMMKHTDTTLANVSDITNGVNTSGKYLGKFITVSGQGYVSQGVLNSSAWRPTHTSGNSNDITPT